jgi:uncharacterized membrane protein
MKEKNLELERLVFFSDAVVAIAITLLALDLKLESTSPGELQFSDLLQFWRKFSSFLLSYLLIALFWMIHHQYFTHIRAIDEKLLWANVFWLLFIVTIPFSTSVLSAHFGEPVSTFIYAVNILMITVFQNVIWDYVAVRPAYLKDDTDPGLIEDYRIYANVAMINALIAVSLSFISPLVAFFILFTRPVMKRITDWMIRAGVKRRTFFGPVAALFLFIVQPIRKKTKKKVNSGKSEEP